jgi:large subunit ribosomal protein L18
VKPLKRLKFRRHREGKTNYRYRLRLLRSGLPRAVVRKTTTHTYVQFAKYEPQGDRIITSASTIEIRKLGWTASTSTTPAAYLTGLLAGLRATKRNIQTAVLDIGLQKPVKGCKVFAALKGIVDGGVEIPYDESILPAEERLVGKHLNLPEDAVLAMKDKIMRGV